MDRILFDSVFWLVLLLARAQEEPVFACQSPVARAVNLYYGVQILLLWGLFLFCAHKRKRRRSNICVQGNKRFLRPVASLNQDNEGGQKSPKKRGKSEILYLCIETGWPDIPVQDNPVQGLLRTADNPVQRLPRTRTTPYKTSPYKTTPYKDFPVQWTSPYNALYHRKKYHSLLSKGLYELIIIIVNSSRSTQS